MRDDQKILMIIATKILVIFKGKSKLYKPKRKNTNIQPKNMAKNATRCKYIKEGASSRGVLLHNTAATETTSSI